MLIVFFHGCLSFCVVLVCILFECILHQSRDWLRQLSPRWLYYNVSSGMLNPFNSTQLTYPKLVPSCRLLDDRETVATHLPPEHLRLSDVSCCQPDTQSNNLCRLAWSASTTNESLPCFKVPQQLVHRGFYNDELTYLLTSLERKVNVRRCWPMMWLVSSSRYVNHDEVWVGFHQLEVFLLSTHITPQLC